MPPMKKYRMMSHRQWGASVKKVLGIPIPARTERDQTNDTDDDRAERRPHGPRFEIARWQLGIGRQSVGLGLVHQQVERVQASEHPLIGTVEIGGALTATVQLFHARLRHRLELA